MTSRRCGVFSNPVIARGGTKRSLRDSGNGREKCHGEALRAVAIQLDHHAWRSQARDDKDAFISREAGRPVAIQPLDRLVEMSLASGLDARKRASLRRTR